MTITPLKDYIILNHNNSPSDFVRAVTLSDNSGKKKITRQAIHRWIKSGDRYVVEKDNTKTIFVKTYTIGE